MILNKTQRTLGFVSLVALLSLAQPFRAAVEEDRSEAGSFVYVMGNQAADNKIMVFHRNADGSLNKVQEVSTNGQGSGGSGDPLGSQGALVLSDEGRLLLAVNQGSSEISSLAVTATGLQFVNKASSGGKGPVSVAVRRDVAYVLNAGGIPNVTAFRIDVRGQLAMIPGSTRPLPGGSNSGPAQVALTPDGEVLVVTEKNTNRIDLYPIDEPGRLGTPSSVPSNGAVPFGFAFSHDRILVVSEAKNSTISSYRIRNAENSPVLDSVTKSLPDLGAAACWLITDDSGRLALVANSGTSTISSLRVSPGGTLQLLAAVAANTGPGTAPIDMALTRDGGFLYVLSTSNGMLLGFRLENGSLSQVASVSGLSLSIQGIAAR